MKPLWIPSHCRIALAGLLFITPSFAVVAIDYVTVGNAGNAADSTGYGAVGYSYKIGKYEVTNSQYTTFLNAVDPGGVNPNGIYSVLMGSDARGGITFTSGSASGTKYTVRSNMGDKPVFCVSWYDAARFVNWMNNGQGSASTETGAYTLSGTTGIVIKNGVASVWLPSEDEWYKAAHYDPNKIGPGIGGYWLYPTMSDAVPTVATAAASGSASNPGTNVVNYLTGADWNGQDGNLTTVGSTAANNTYGTFDQAGNVWEWNDAVVSGTSRGTRGGSWGDAEGNLKSRNANGPTVEHQYIGFRIASTVGAPVAAFTAIPIAAAPAQAVNFNASTSTSSAPFVSYSWTWGDASPAGSGVTATHSYSHFGSYVVRLTVTDDLTRTATTTTTVDVNQGNVAPVAHAGGSYSIGVGQDLALSGSGSSDPNVSAGDSIVSYQWDVNGDGNYSDATGVSPTLSWFTLHGLGFGIPTTHTLWLRVTDSFGLTGITSTTLQVDARAPSADFTTASTVPLTANGFTATGLTVGAMTLGFDPTPGQVLTLVNNTSANPIGGAFNDLPNGAIILTTYGGRSLLFIASYSGGDGNDLILTLLNPEIVVEQPLFTSIADDGSRNFGTIVLGSPLSLSFTIKNTGGGILNGLTITKSGADQADFQLTATPVSPVSFGLTGFTVQFNPTTPGAKTAEIHLASDDADEDPFNIILTGEAISSTDDTDADGLNDVAEFKLIPLGFDWQVSQPAQVNSFLADSGLFQQSHLDASRLAGRDDVINAPNPFGLYTLAQLQALNIGTPLLAKDPGTGQFKLTLALEKSTDLATFAPFPFVELETSINAAGKIEFLFTSPDDAAFFRVEAE